MTHAILTTEVESETLTRIAEQDERVAEYEYLADDDDHHYLWLSEGYTSHRGTASCCGTVEECLAQLARVRVDPDE